MRVALDSETETLAFGAQLARALIGATAAAAHNAALVGGPGAGALRLWLQGGLGAGKTTLTRGLLAALGHRGNVKSPSYTLVEPYTLAAADVLHIDLYRLRNADEITGLGLAEYDRGGILWVIEWPERAEGRVGAADLALQIDFAGEGRRIQAQSGSDRGRAWLDQLEKVSVAG